MISFKAVTDKSWLVGMQVELALMLVEFATGHSALLIAVATGHSALIIAVATGHSIFDCWILLFQYSDAYNGQYINLNMCSQHEHVCFNTK